VHLQRSDENFSKAQGRVQSVVFFSGIEIYGEDQIHHVLPMMVLLILNELFMKGLNAGEGVGVFIIDIFSSIFPE
jgi:hypothetical protein